jgi:hypothetical protein
MPKCLRCSGQGKESYDDGGRLVTDTCYHCAGAGEVEPEVYLQDRLMQVAYSLAYQDEMEYRKACDADPNGDGYDLGAAENMLSVHDYFQGRVSDRQYKLLAQMQQLDSVIQNALLDWNEKRPSERPTEPAPSPNGAKPTVEDVAAPLFIYIFTEVNMSTIFGDDDIPF